MWIKHGMHCILLIKSFNRPSCHWSLAASTWCVHRQMTHKLFAEQGGKGVSLSRFRTFLKRLQDGMLKLEFAHYDTAGSAAHTHTHATGYCQPALTATAG
jgi:hypothetical protein